MTNAFSLSASQCAAAKHAALRTEITEHTGNDIETAGILRSIERFGGDNSIERFEISRSERGRYASRSNTAGWIVRAVRAGAPQKD
jgi:hypothetical protein